MMYRAFRSASGVVCVAAALLLCACSSAPKGSVSQDELERIKTSAHTVSPGQKKADVFAKYAGANLVRLAATQLEGVTIEEWKSEAFHDSEKGRDLSIQFLYFRNDVLVDISDARLDFRTDTAITKRWAGGDKK